MKRAYSILFLLSASLLFTSCNKKESLSSVMTDTTQNVSTQTSGEAVDRVAGDKELLRQAIILADKKGTLEAALTEAAQDSIVGIKMRRALILGNNAKSQTTPPPSSNPGTVKKSSSQKTSQKSNGDAIDQVNSGLDKAGNTIDRTNQTINKAQDVNKKVGDIFRH